MSQGKLKNKIKNRTFQFNRRYSSDVFWIPEEKSAIIESSLNDPHHEMTLFLEVNLKNLKITNYEVEERRIPFTSCPKAAENYQYLIGEDLSESKLAKKFPVPNSLGCLHINELIQHAANAFTHAYAFYVKDKHFPENYDEYKMDKGELDLITRTNISRIWWMKDIKVKNSCLSYTDVYKDENLETYTKDIPPIRKMMLMEYRDLK